MTQQEVKDNVGMIVMVNGSGDLSMTHKHDIGRLFYIKSLTKGGMVYLQRVDNKKKTTTVPPKNVDLVDMQYSAWVEANMSKL